MMLVPIESDELAAIAPTIDKFRLEVLAPRVERPELRLPDAELSRLSDLAVDAGILNLGDEAAFGVWDGFGEFDALGLSTLVLRELARANAGVAFHFHQLALGAWLGRALGYGLPGPTVACLQGRYGLGRDLLPAWLRARVLAAPECTWLADYFASEPGQSLLVQAGAPLEHVLMPRFDAASGVLGFDAFERTAVSLVERRSSHGLDETSTWVVTRPGGSSLRAGDDQGGRVVYARALALNALGVMAIGTGALAAACEMAREYAATRQQGGQLIERFPAVQQLLGGAQAALDTALLTTGFLAQGSLERLDLGQILGARAKMHPLLCRAANDALQVFGGLGYMRDTGMEKIVRDQNHLRVCFGTPLELDVFVNVWRRG